MAGILFFPKKDHVKGFHLQKKLGTKHEGIVTKMARENNFRGHFLGKRLAVVNKINSK